VEYNHRYFDAMLAEIVASIGPAQPRKREYWAAMAAVPAAPQVVAPPQPEWPVPHPPIISPVVTPPVLISQGVKSASFNWGLAGLLFLAAFVPGLVNTFRGPSSLMLQLLGNAFLLSIVMAVGTTVISQKVRNPVTVSALCGLNQLVSTYFLGALFFGSYRLYALGLLAFVYGALVPGAVAVSRIPRLPRWILLVAPFGGMMLYSILGVVAGVPGLADVFQFAVRFAISIFMGVAFFIGVRKEDSA
jgi:hypothetical protein